MMLEIEKKKSSMEQNELWFREDKEFPTGPQRFFKAMT